MHWQDEAIILRSRKFGERDLFVTCFTRDNGIYSGIVKAGQTKAKMPIIQIGNIVNASWKARLEEHLGTISAELMEAVTAKLMSDNLRLKALISACTMVCSTMQDREKDHELYLKLRKLIDDLIGNEFWITDYIFFEYELLHHLGFGLDLSKCAVTNSTDNLRYISPRTGRAVSEEGAKGYTDKIFKLPQFLIGKQALESDILTALDIFEHFFNKSFFQPHNKKLPEERQMLLKGLQKIYG